MAVARVSFHLHFGDVSLFVSSLQTVSVVLTLEHYFWEMATKSEREALVEQNEGGQPVECDLCRFQPNKAQGESVDDGISWLRIVAIVVGSVLVMWQPLLSVALKHRLCVE